MIFAFGKINWIRPMWAKLFGVLSMKKGAAVFRYTRVRCRYSSPSAFSSAGEKAARTSG